MTHIIEKLNRMAEAPGPRPEFDVWLAMGDALGLLRDDAQDDDFLVYASDQGIYIYTVAVPEGAVTPPDIDDLMGWNCDPSSSWGVSVQYFEPRRVWIAPPLEHTDSRALDQGEKLLFARHFEGLLEGKKRYYEVSQKFTHLFDLHLMEEHQAYCRLDDRGDVEEVIRIVEGEARGEVDGATAVTFKRDLLDQYLALTDAVLVRMFDFTRYRPGQFGGWCDDQDRRVRCDGNLHYRLHIEPGRASYARGIQLVRPLTPKDVVIGRFYPGNADERQYASFIAMDWRNGVVREISCAPGATDNYFTKSDLPFELSPAFFNPEVLRKYKADSEKYRLAGRSISCRGAWSLQTYDVNDEGQVHTYLVYLRNLPYEEQLYWKSYNEPPKGPISKRAFKTDFEGEWLLDYDGRNSLLLVVGDLHRDQVPWWTLRSEKLREQLHYPVTLSADEWAEEILHLDQLLVEGFETKWLRVKAQGLSRKPDIKFASLKLVEECLAGTGFAGEDARNVVAPLRELHELRSKVKGHAAGKDAAALRKRILNEHRTYKAHFQALCQRCDESMRAIAEAFGKIG
jgi:hypothetical protein